MWEWFTKARAKNIPVSGRYDSGEGFNVCWRKGAFRLYCFKWLVEQMAETP